MVGRIPALRLYWTSRLIAASQIGYIVKKVFISSTSELASYREASVRVCNQLGLQPVAVMEFYPAQDTPPLELCQRLVRESDIYVAILAHNYGSIVPGDTRSFTHVEFDEATATGKSRLCFLVKPDYPWPPTHVDHQHKDKLDALKAEISGAMVRKEFTTEADFAQQLTLALTPYVTQSPAAAQVSAAPVFNTNIPAVFAVGRNTDLQRIKTALADTSILNPLVIRGLPGVGKTTFVSLLAHDAEIRQRYPDGVIRLEIGEEPDVTGLLRQLARLLSEAPAPQRDAELISHIESLLNGRRMILLIDDIWNKDHAMPFVRAAQSVRTLVTTRFQDVAYELVAMPQAQIMPLDVLAESDALELLRRTSPRFVDERPEAARQLVDDIERLPLAIIVVGRMIHREMARGSAHLDSLLQNIERILNESAPPDRYQRELGRIPSVRELIEQSVNYLEPMDQIAFASLGAFAPKPAYFDLGAMGAVWADPDPAAQAARLMDRGLLEFVPERELYQMHAVLVMYAREMLG